MAGGLGGVCAGHQDQYVRPVGSEPLGKTINTRRNAADGVQFRKPPMINAIAPAMVMKKIMGIMV